MNYRHIKRICRGEAPPKFVIINNDTKSGMAGLRLRQYIYNVVYVPQRLGKRYRPFDIFNDKCIIEQDEPVYWFTCRNEGIAFLIGVKLNDLMRVLLESESKSPTIWGASVANIFRTYISHLKWRLKRDGIKYTKANFNGIRDIDGYNIVHRQKLVYSTMARIFINYTKQLSKWQMK